MYKASHKSAITQEAVEQNAADIEAYNNWTASMEDVSKNLQEELMLAYERLNDAPYMQLNPYDCTCHKIVIAFDQNNDVSRSGLVEAWMTDRYGNPWTDDAVYLFSVDGSPGETEISIWDTSNYDLEAAGKDIENYVAQMAAESDLPVLAVAHTVSSGYSAKLFEIQDALRSNVTRLQNELTAYTSNKLTPPAKISANRVSKRGLIKYVLMGIIAGLFCGIAFTIYRIVRKGTLLSSNQVWEAFKLEEFGSYASGNVDGVALLGAAIDAAAGDAQRILLFNDADTDKCDELVSALNISAPREFKCGSGLTENAVCAEMLRNSDAAIISLRYGKTTLNDVQKSIRWAQRFKKDVLGYIVLEE